MGTWLLGKLIQSKVIDSVEPFWLSEFSTKVRIIHISVLILLFQIFTARLFLTLSYLKYLHIHENRRLKNTILGSLRFSTVQAHTMSGFRNFVGG